MCSETTVHEIRIIGNINECNEKERQMSKNLSPQTPPAAVHDLQASARLYASQQ